MNETHHEPLTVWRFIRRHFVRIGIGAVLVVAVYGVISIYATFQREQRIAKEIRVHGGKVEFQYRGPNWIPQSMRDRTILFSRVTFLDLRNTQITDAGLGHLKELTSLVFLELTNSQFNDAKLKHLKGLTNLTILLLDSTQVTDAGLKHLKGLTNLVFLDLVDTQVTDAGLEHLKGLTKLEELKLHGTRTTEEGVEMLREALPDCKIERDEWLSF